ncbi:hypothetical protein CYMTET_50717 [Cymbomonas tetramitiformis]|uniref:Uncharacterized protein n=1 Tax=Cymbomonas tetramitiformis TaxID=36881 RepID=A0AAE0BMQ9_9CHLO|nr:hypothetical protein CYMTET_50717 [Cymbomonas tetramitiformis]
MAESPVVDDLDRLIRTGKEMSREPADQTVPAERSGLLPELGRRNVPASGLIRLQEPARLELICQPLLMQLPPLMASFPAR